MHPKVTLLAIPLGCVIKGKFKQTTSTDSKSALMRCAIFDTIIYPRTKARGARLAT